MLLLAALLQNAAACTGRGGHVLTSADPLPVDAAAVVTGSVVSITVVNADDTEVPGAVSWECDDSDGLEDDYCRVAFLPDENWIAGATYTLHGVSLEYAYTGVSGEVTHQVNIAVDGHVVTPVSGAAEVEILTVGIDTGNTPCLFPDARGYELRLTAAAPDPDGLSYLRLERRDGYQRFTPLPAEAAPLDWTVWGPSVDSEDDCFRVTQVDGAGNASTPSEWRCVSDIELAAGCGCSSASKGGTYSTAMILAAGLGASMRRWRRTRRLG